MLKDSCCFSDYRLGSAGYLLAFFNRRWECARRHAMQRLHSIME